MRNNPGLGIMAQVMQTDGGMTATVYPAQLVAQHIEDAVYLSISERSPQQPAATADQKRHVCGRGHVPCACFAIFRQCGDRRRVDWQ